MNHWYFGTLAVNLEGIEWQGKHVAALLDHDATRRVGYTTKLYRDEESGLVAEGVMLSNDDATRVRADSEEGFPWQASCYLVANEVTALDKGDSAEVNGHTVEGPATIFNSSQLREVTFCALGADPNTASDASLSDGAEVVHASLSDSGVTMADNDNTTHEPVPVAPVVDTEAVRSDARQAESERVSYILELSADCQIDLARKLIKEQVSEREASLALAKDAKEREQHLSPSTVVQPHTEALAAPQSDAVELPEGEDKWRADWKQDAQLRAEFGGKEAVWLAWNLNKHRCRSFGNKETAQ